MEDITVIIPIHKLDDSNEQLFSDSLKSLFSQTEKIGQIIIVGPENAMPKRKVSDNTTILINNGDTDYCSQINLAVKNVKTKYFSILEFDDTYTPNWFKNIKDYLKVKQDVSLLLPIIQYVDADKNDICLGNEISWTASFVDGEDRLGGIDHDMLQGYYDFSPVGGVFKTKDFIEVGGLKPSIKLSFWYEFMLRLTSNDYKIFVIPKRGYVHMVNRGGSLTNETVGMEEKEKLFWLDLAKKEYYFKNERPEKAVYIIKKGIDEIL